MKKLLLCDKNTTKKRIKIEPYKLVSKIRPFHPLKRRHVNLQKIKIAFSSSKKQKSRNFELKKIQRNDFFKWLEANHIKILKSHEDFYIINGRGYSFDRLLVLVNKLRFKKGLNPFKIL